MSLAPGSDRLALIQPLITPAVNKLILRRLAQHVGLVKENENLNEKRKLEIKLALLAVHIINPFEEFFSPEEALIRGISTDTLNRRREEERADPKRALKKL